MRPREVSDVILLGHSSGAIFSYRIAVEMDVDALIVSGGSHLAQQHAWPEPSPLAGNFNVLVL